MVDTCRRDRANTDQYGWILRAASSCVLKNDGREDSKELENESRMKIKSESRKAISTAQLESEHPI
jgi:hypothetical protein